MQFCLEVPWLSPRALAFLEATCRNSATAAIGLATLRYIVLLRPALRQRAFPALLAFAADPGLPRPAARTGGACLSSRPFVPSFKFMTYIWQRILLDAPAKEIRTTAIRVAVDKLYTIPALQSDVVDAARKVNPPSLFKGEEFIFGFLRLPSQSLNRLTVAFVPEPKEEGKPAPEPPKEHAVAMTEQEVNAALNLYFVLSTKDETLVNGSAVEIYFAVLY